MPSKKIKSMTKAEFDKLSNKEIANLSMDDAQYLMSKFMKGMFGQDESDIKMRKKGGVIKGKGYAHGGMSKRMGHTDYRKGGMFK
tara:strand:- start:156 stop:410 length:255 start_codon:yes stop_codon:yes gene_type:complete